MRKKPSHLIKSKVLYPISRKDSVFFLKHKRLLFLTLGIFGTGIFLTYGVLKISEQIPFWLENLSQKVGFVVDDIRVEGRQNTSRIDLLKALEIKRGDPLFSFSLDTLKKNLEKLPWICAAIVERQLPNTFHIHLAERKALALWQVRGSFRLLDREGKTITCPPQEFPQGMLVVVGDQAPKYVKKLLSAFEKIPGIKQRVTAAVHLRSGRWDLHLDNKWILKLPENSLEEALRHFLSFEYKYRFLNHKVMAVDLRLPGIFIVRLKPGEAQKGRAQKPKNTSLRKDV